MLKKDKKIKGVPREPMLDLLDGLGRMDMLRLRILLCVAKQPRYPASFYAHRLGVDASAMCKVVRSMTDEGYYSRPRMAQGVLRRSRAADRREMLLDLTDNGRKLLEMLRQEIRYLRLSPRTGGTDTCA